MALGLGSHKYFQFQKEIDVTKEVTEKILEIRCFSGPTFLLTGVGRSHLANRHHICVRARKRIQNRPGDSR